VEIPKFETLPLFATLVRLGHLNFFSRQSGSDHSPETFAIMGQ